MIDPGEATEFLSGWRPYWELKGWPVEVVVEAYHVLGRWVRLVDAHHDAGLDFPLYKAGR